MPAESTSVAMPHRSIAVFLKRKQSRAQGSQDITDNALASRGVKPHSAVAAVIHAASDQALREPKQTNETGGDDQQGQDSVCDAGLEKLLRLRRVLCGRQPIQHPLKGNGLHVRVIWRS